MNIFRIFILCISACTFYTIVYFFCEPFFHDTELGPFYIAIIFVTITSIIVSFFTTKKLNLGLINEQSIIEKIKSSVSKDVYKNADVIQLYTLNEKGSDNNKSVDDLWKVTEAIAKNLNAECTSFEEIISRDIKQFNESSDENSILVIHCASKRRKEQVIDFIKKFNGKIILVDFKTVTGLDSAILAEKKKIVTHEINHYLN
jgi:hypothetical protein